MKYTIKYEGNNGVIDFNSAPYLLKNPEALFNFEISVNSTLNQLENREIIDCFYFGGKSVDLEIQILGKNKEQLIDQLDFYFNNDRELLSPSKLIVNDYYVYCYVIKSENRYFTKFRNFEVINYTFKFTSRWIKEDIIDFRRNDDIKNEMGLRYPMSYPFSYKALKRELMINNENYASAKAKIIFYGPCVNPKITINDNIYSVEANLLENERIEIEPFEKTVIKYTAAGNAIDMMNYRYKKQSVFTEIPTGTSLLVKDSEFSCRLILYYERGIPAWS